MGGLVRSPAGPCAPTVPAPLKAAAALPRCPAPACDTEEFACVAGDAAGGGVGTGGGVGIGGADGGPENNAPIDIHPVVGDATVYTIVKKVSIGLTFSYTCARIGPWNCGLFSDPLH